MPALFLAKKPMGWYNWALRQNPQKPIFAVRVRPSSSVKPGLGGNDGSPIEHIDYTPGKASVLEILPIKDAARKYPKDFEPMRRTRYDIDQGIHHPDLRGLGKVEAPGPAHAATAPASQEGATGPAMQGAKGPPPAPRKLPLAPGMIKPAKTLKVSKSQSETKCGLCGLGQFKAGCFAGCLCFRSLSKSVRTTVDGDGYLLEFRGWDEEALQTLLETIGSK